MPVLFFALLGIGVANQALRPITAKIESRRDLEALKAGKLTLGRVGEHFVIASPMNVALWAMAIEPSELPELDAARERFQRMRQINPLGVDRLCRSL